MAKITTAVYDTDTLDDAAMYAVDTGMEPSPLAPPPDGDTPDCPDTPEPSPRLSAADLRYMERLAADFLAPRGFRAKRLTVDGDRALVVIGPAGKMLVESPAVLVSLIVAACGG